MSDTFKFWLAANFGIILTVISMSVSAALAFAIGGTEFWGDASSLVLVFVLTALFVAFPGKKISDSLGFYTIVICFLSVFLSGASANDFDDFSVIFKSGFFIYCCVCLVGSWVISGILMPFVSANIDEIVSRCMRYRNSNVDLFEFKWKYMIALFLDISRAVFGNAVIFGFVISRF